MPEITECYKLLRQLEPAWTGSRVGNITVPNGSSNPLKYLQGGDWKSFTKTLFQTDIERMTRHGKKLFVHLKSGHTWEIHLSSTGWFLPYGPQPIYSKIDLIHKNFLHKINGRNARLRLLFWDGQTWNYHDPRTWGKWWFHQPGWKPDTTAPDWLKEPEAAKTALLTHRSRRRAQDVLCDQRVTAGLGYYTSCEILWRAHVHPHTRWDLVTEKERAMLGLRTRMFLNLCLEKDDHSHWQVFDKTGEPCSRHQDQAILYTKNGGSGRGSYYCPRCQEKQE